MTTLRTATQAALAVLVPYMLLTLATWWTR
jgi:hypothetical protein